MQRKGLNEINRNKGSELCFLERLYVKQFEQHSSGALVQNMDNIRVHGGTSKIKMILILLKLVK